MESRTGWISPVQLLHRLSEESRCVNTEANRIVAECLEVIATRMVTSPDRANLVAEIDLESLPERPSRRRR